MKILKSRIRNEIVCTSDERRNINAFRLSMFGNNFLHDTIYLTNKNIKNFGHILIIYLQIATQMVLVNVESYTVFIGECMTLT